MCVFFKEKNVEQMKDVEHMKEVEQGARRSLKDEINHFSSSKFMRANVYFIINFSARVQTQNKRMPIWQLTRQWQHRQLHRQSPPKQQRTERCNYHNGTSAVYHNKPPHRLLRPVAHRTLAHSNLGVNRFNQCSMDPRDQFLITRHWERQAKYSRLTPEHSTEPTHHPGLASPGYNTKETYYNWQRENRAG